MARATGTRGRRWITPLALAAAAPMLVVVWVAVASSSSDLGPSPGWLVIPIGLAAATGLVGGIGRGLAATIGVWVLFVVLLAVLFGPGCPLNMSWVPHGPSGPRGTAVLAYIGHVEECSDGTRHSELGGGAFWATIFAVVATLATAVGGILGDAYRWWQGRRRFLAAP